MSRQAFKKGIHSEELIRVNHTLQQIVFGQGLEVILIPQAKKFILHRLFFLLKEHYTSILSMGNLELHTR